jgi:hypothetical protein
MRCGSREVVPTDALMLWCRHTLTYATHAQMLWRSRRMRCGSREVEPRRRLHPSSFASQVLSLLNSTSMQCKY